VKRAYQRLCDANLIVFMLATVEAPAEDQADTILKYLRARRYI
jgi:hypothetical protein